MGTNIAQATISGIEAELKILKAQLSDLGQKAKKKFISLQGLWKGKSNFSLGDIRKAEIKLKRSY